MDRAVDKGFRGLGNNYRWGGDEESSYFEDR